MRIFLITAHVVRHVTSGNEFHWRSVLCAKYRHRLIDDGVVVLLNTLSITLTVLYSAVYVDSIMVVILVKNDCILL